MTRTPVTNRRRTAGDRRGRELLAELYGADGPPDLEVLASPVRLA